MGTGTEHDVLTKTLTGLVFIAVHITGHDRHVQNFELHWLASFRKSICDSRYNGIRTQVNPQIGSNIPVIGGFESCRVVVVVNRIGISDAVTTRLSIDIAKRELGTEMTQWKMTAEP
jgi:hypothetical protein